MGDLITEVIEASTRGLVVDDRVLDVSVEGPDGVGETTFTYRVVDTVVAVRRLRVDHATRTVSMLDVERRKWWFDDVALHAQILARLDADCVVTMVVSGPRSVLWASHFDWTPLLANANAAALAAAVSAVTPAPSEVEELDELDEARWGGSDLPDRVLGLGGGGWRDLLQALSPAQLSEALEGLHPGLAAVVFAHIPAWHGRRALSTRVRAA